MTGTTSDTMPTGTMAGTPQLLLAHHLKQLKLPTVLREYEKVARECAQGGVDHTVRALQNWRLRGGGPRYVKVGSRSVRYRQSDLLKWIEDRTVTTSPGDSAGASCVST